MTEPTDARLVDHLTHLARLGITPKERTRQTKDFQDVVGFVEQIASVPVSASPLLTTVSGVSGVFREDLDEPSTLADALLAVAPERHGRFIRVPRVL